MVNQMVNFDDSKGEVGVEECSLPVCKYLLLIRLTNTEYVFSAMRCAKLHGHLHRACNPLWKYACEDGI